MPSPERSKPIKSKKQISHQERLELLAKPLLTMEEAAELAAKLAGEMGLDSSPKPETLRKAAKDKRLVAVLKGKHLLLTDAIALREFLAKEFDPKNRSHSRQVANPKVAERVRRYRAARTVLAEAAKVGGPGA